MAKKTIRVSDQSGDEIPEGRGATVRITFADARKGVRELDLTDAEAERLGGRAVARRGRRPRLLRLKESLERKETRPPPRRLRQRQGSHSGAARGGLSSARLGSAVPD